VTPYDQSSVVSALRTFFLPGLTGVATPAMKRGGQTPAVIGRSHIETEPPSIHVVER
jgi:hypothetical protein